MFGGDFNVSKRQNNANVTTLQNFRSVNGLLWLDAVSSGVNYIIMLILIDSIV